jgi:hypothetical protein
MFIFMMDDFSEDIIFTMLTPLLLQEKGSGDEAKAGKRPILGLRPPLSLRKEDNSLNYEFI